LPRITMAVEKENVGAGRFVVAAHMAGSQRHATAAGKMNGSKTRSSWIRYRDIRDDFLVVEVARIGGHRAFSVLWRHQRVDAVVVTLDQIKISQAAVRAGLSDAAEIGV